MVGMYSDIMRSIVKRAEAAETRTRDLETALGIVLKDNERIRAECSAEWPEMAAMRRRAEAAEARADRAEESVESLRKTFMGGSSVTVEQRLRAERAEARVRELEHKLDTIEDETIKRCMTTALEQRCERGTPWDKACVTISEAIRSIPSGHGWPRRL